MKYNIILYLLTIGNFGMILDGWIEPLHLLAGIICMIFFLQRTGHIETKSKNKGGEASTEEKHNKTKP